MYWNVVVDPVMVSTSGSRLLSDEAYQALVEDLLPLGAVLTPNLSEAQVLCGFPVVGEADMVRAAREISRRYSGAILIKGGHLTQDAADLLYRDGQALGSARPGTNPHYPWNRCILSSAIACGPWAGL